MKDIYNNKLGYLSLFSLIGFLGLFTEYTSFVWFFGFIGYTYYFKVVPDELFKINLGKASAVTLLIMLILLSALLVAGTVSDNYEVFFWGVPVSFLIGNVAFAITQSVYEAKESSGAKNEDI